MLFICFAFIEKLFCDTCFSLSRNVFLLQFLILKSFWPLNQSCFVFAYFDPKLQFISCLLSFNLISFWFSRLELPVTIPWHVLEPDTKWCLWSKTWTIEYLLNKYGLLRKWLILVCYTVWISGACFSKIEMCLQWRIIFGK